MVERVKNQDLDLMVSAIVISSQVGGNLSDILDVISHTVKDRIRIQQEIRVLTSQGRMSGLIIALLPAVLMVLLMLLNPGYFTEFFASPVGKTMLGVSVIMEVIGFMVINKIINIES